MSSLLSRLGRPVGRTKRFLDEVHVTRRRLVEHAAWLQPGDWVPASTTLEVWRHANAELPAPLIAEGGKASHKHKAASAVTPSHLVKRRILMTMRRVQKSLHAHTATIPPVEARWGNATVAVFTGDKRADLVALEPSQRRAVRVGRRGSYDHEYMDARTRFQHYLPAPGFSVSQDGAVLIEDWCEGQLLSELPSQRQFSISLDLLGRYVALTANESIPDHGTPWQKLGALLEDVSVPGALRSLLTDQRVQRLLHSGLLAPSQGGGVGPFEIIVDERDTAFYLLDFDKAGWRPIWFDAISIATGTVRSCGGLDERERRAIAATLDRIWAAAGLEDAAGLTNQHWAALTVVKTAWFKTGRTEHTSVASGFVQPDPRDFVRRLEVEARRRRAELATP